MLAPLFGYFFSMVAVLTATVVLLTSFSNVSMIGNGRQHLRPPVIGRTVAVEVQRRPPVAKEGSAAKDVTPVAAAAKAETEKSKHYKPKVFARQRENYGYGNAPGYAQEYGFGPRGTFFQ